MLLHSVQGASDINGKGGSSKLSGQLTHRRSAPKAVGNAPVGKADSWPMVRILTISHQSLPRTSHVATSSLREGITLKVSGTRRSFWMENSSLFGCSQWVGFALYSTSFLSDDQLQGVNSDRVVRAENPHASAAVRSSSHEW